MKIKRLVFFILLLSLSSILQSQTKVSFLVDDGFGASVNRSMHLLKKTYPDIAKKCQFQEFIYSNYHESDLDFFENSDLIFIALHNNGYIFKAKAQLLSALNRGAKVYALNMSHEYDSELQSWGVRFDEWTLAAFKNGGENNIMNIVLQKLNKDFGFDCSYGDIELTPFSGIYNYKNKRLHTNIGSFISERHDLKESQPWIGLVVGRSDLTKAQYLYMDAFIQNIENEGFNVLPVFTSQQPGSQQDEALKKYFTPSDTMPQVSAILNLGCWFNIRPAQEREVLEKLGIPVINGIILDTNQKDWEESLIGINIYNRSNLVAIPELVGYINPSVAVVFDDVSHNVKIKNAVDYQMKTILGRIRNIYNLQSKPNKDKHIALIYYSYPPGKENIGASYLNVLPNSLVSILKRLQHEEYNTGSNPIDSATVFNKVMDAGRNIGSWAPAEVDKLVKTGDPVLVPMDVYKKWYNNMSPKIRAEMEHKWGRPEDSQLMTWTDKYGQTYFVLPMIKYGNIVLTPQPPRGWVDNAKSLYHDPLVPPPHQYLAYYLYLKFGLKADAVAHIGTHGTHEWLPGKEAGLNRDDYPEALIMDIPNIYPYIVDNVGEGLQAKRRGQAVIIDHMTPPFDKASLNPELRDVKNSISKYYDQKSKSPIASRIIYDDLVSKIDSLGILKDLSIDSITDQNLEIIDDYIKEIEEKQTPFGLHTFGVSPPEKYIESTTDAIMSMKKDISGDARNKFRQEVKNNLIKSGEEELNSFIDALNGKYIRSGTGNDPIRNPSSLPTGKNFFAFDPRLIPSRSTYSFGEKLAEELIVKYRSDNKGEYPSKVTINLWTVECIRNEGTMEAQALSLLGVRPVYNSSEQVVDLELIPKEELKRPRVDVVFAPSGLYRDIFPELMALLDKAVSIARTADEDNNFVRQHILESEDKLKKMGVADDSLAQRIASVRLFTSPSGSYGTGVSGTVQASGTWDDEKDVAEIYFNRMGHLYGQGFWGTKVEDEYTYLPKDFSKNVFKNALSGTKVALHSRSSNMYALLDNDDMFQYLGATAMAIRTLDGKSPTVMLTNMIDPTAPNQETLEKFLGRELKTRYLNPKWVDQMVNEGYAGARFINKMVFNLWGWEATMPESVSDNDWNQIYETYIEDKYKLNIKQRFKDSGNLYAYQSMLSRMIETVRKGYWQADEQTLNKMLTQFNETIKDVGLACNLNVCNNEKLIDYISGKINDMPSMSAEEKSRYKSALQKLKSSSKGGNDIDKGKSESDLNISIKSTFKDLNKKMGK